MRRHTHCYEQGQMHNDIDMTPNQYGNICQCVQKEANNFSVFNHYPYSDTARRRAKPMPDFVRKSNLPLL